MTLGELSQLYRLNREIEDLKMRISELENAATDTSVKISGMPRGGTAGDKLGTMAVQLVCYRAELELRFKQCRIELRRLNAYISRCPDSFTRQILTLRFIDGLSWTRVAESIGGTSEYAVKKTAYRYIRKH